MKTRLLEWLFMIRLLARLAIRPLYGVERLEAFCRAELAGRPTAFLPRFFLASLYKDYLRNEEAKREYSELAKCGSMREADRLSLGEVLYRLGDHRGVVESLSPIIDRFPRKKDSNWYLAISYMEIGDHSSAAIYLQRAIDAGLRRSDDYWRLGICHDRLDRLEDAAKAYSQALSMKPNSRELKTNLASVYFRWGQLVQGTDSRLAVQMYRKALDLIPENVAAIAALTSLSQRRN